ncbi:putative fatty acyl-CoA reductase 7 [Oryza brachyantha]|uniref:putative fatty acyl-CoA reductase 7 n=1 Tax=Oryza brachyantha TaxID=4533 RepID=UPI001ADACF97|nr:putative fatty acyl-CoA reductase 7 [Oryza brachyantha]
MSNMVGTMDEGRIIEYFKNKTVLITGSTGFLGKILVEKILRVQPDVRKIYLPVRAVDSATAKQRMQTEVIGKELFGLLKEQHGKGFESFIDAKVVPLAADMMHHNLGLEDSTLREITQDLNIIVNGAATTNFYERYDVSLDVNVMGVKYLCQLAKKCAKLEVFLHVSTAYVCGEKQGVVKERAFRVGETLREGTQLDIEEEVRLVAEQKQRLEEAGDVKAERKAMKELGLERARHFGWPNTYVFSKAMGEMMLQEQLVGRGSGIAVVIARPSIITSVHRDPLPGWIEGTRTIDAIIIGYAKQSLSCFLADLDLIMDVVPGDLVVNAMMAAMAAAAEPELTVYHVTSSVRNPAAYAVLYRTGFRYFTENPRVGKDGRVVRTREMHFFRSIASFRAFMAVAYALPLQLLRLLSLLCFGLLFARRYAELSRKYAFVMHLVDLYGPFALFKACFDDLNMDTLRSSFSMASSSRLFHMDPKAIDWDDYFYRIHIPGVIKYVLKK